MLFDSYEDASGWYATSDYKELQWYNGFEEEQLIEFAYRNGSDHDAEDPEDYDL